MRRAKRRWAIGGLILAVLAVVALVTPLGEREASDPDAPGPADSVTVPAARRSSGVRLRVDAAGDAAVVGRAADEAGAPAAGVEVCVRALAPVPDRPDTFRDTLLRRCARTGEDGTFAVRELLAGTSPLVEATAPMRVVTRIDGAPGVFAALLEPGERRRIDLLVRTTSSLTVQVDDEGGGPVAGAEVLVRGDGGARCAESKVLSDAAGAARAWCLPDDYRVTVQSEGYVPEHRRSSAPGEIRTTLRPGSSISGRLVGDVVLDGVPIGVVGHGPSPFAQQTSTLFRPSSHGGNRAHRSRRCVRHRWTRRCRRRRERGS